LIISHKKVNYTIALEKINSIELLKLDREIVIKTHDTEYRYKAYRLGKKKIERFFEANKIPVKINM
jgi:hemin uptake protein HemP